MGYGHIFVKGKKQIPVLPLFVFVHFIFIIKDPLHHLVSLNSFTAEQLSKIASLNVFVMRDGKAINIVLFTVLVTRHMWLLSI